MRHRWHDREAEVMFSKFRCPVRPTRASQTRQRANVSDCVFPPKRSRTTLCTQSTLAEADRRAPSGGGGAGVSQVSLQKATPPPPTSESSAVIWGTFYVDIHVPGR